MSFGTAGISSSETTDLHRHIREGKTGRQRRNSAECDGQVIWGGDMTVEEIRRFRSARQRRRSSLPDRASIAVVLTRMPFLPLSEEGLAETAMRFTTIPSAWIRTPARLLGQYSGGRAVQKREKRRPGDSGRHSAQTAKRYGLPRA